jgi:hypothetical protein
MRGKMMSVWVTIILAGIALTAWNDYENSQHIKATETIATTQRSRLRHDEQRLTVALHTLAVSQKASTQTRVATVSQRCELTNLILGVLVRVHDTTDSRGFLKSEAKCLSQLASVKAINTATPTPK